MEEIRKGRQKIKNVAMRKLNRAIPAVATGLVLVGLMLFNIAAAQIGSGGIPPGQTWFLNGTTVQTVDSSWNVSIGGDLTVSGDDITLGTNTEGTILVGDGTNFNPVAVSGDLTATSTGAFTIAANAVEESMLKAVDEAADEECFTYESTTGDFEWQACGSGDSVSIDGGAVVDPDFVSTDDIDFIDTSNTITAAINAGVILEADLNADEAPTDNDILTYDSTGANFSWQTPAELSLQTQGDVLDDFNTLGAPTADGEFIVATGAGAFAYEATSTARTSLGLGTIATQAANSVAITGGSITGITDLVVADGGTGASTLTDGGILLGSGTSAVTAMAVLDAGDIVIGDGTTDPTELAAFTSATGQLKHEYGGVELDISGIGTGDVLGGASAGTMEIIDGGAASDGDVLTIQADGTANFEAASGGSPTKEFFVPVTGFVNNGTLATTDPYNTEITANSIASVGDSDDEWYFTFHIPADFTTTTAVELVMYPDATESINLDLRGGYGAVGQTVNNDAFSGNFTPTVTSTQLTDVDIFTGENSWDNLAASDYVDVKIEGNTSNLRIIGLRFKYN